MLYFQPVENSQQREAIMYEHIHQKDKENPKLQRKTRSSLDIDIGSKTGSVG